MKQVKTLTTVVVFVQIKEKLLQLTDKRKEMIDKWEDRWEWLRLSKTRTLCSCTQTLSNPNKQKPAAFTQISGLTAAAGLIWM